MHHFSDVCFVPISPGLCFVFHRAEHINFSKVQFVTFSFAHHVSGIVPKNSSSITWYRLCAAISSQSVIAVHAPCGAMIDYEFIFVQCVRCVSRSTFNIAILKLTRTVSARLPFLRGTSFTDYQ